ncbi:hypothetical protein G7054_g11748 [Neopestalotiopsis clavispora]|nr:hypothetical protein G7054_g11748 [Neopestalotiopsis clavispora]
MQDLIFLALLSNLPLSLAQALVQVQGNGVEYLGTQNLTSGINTFRGIKYAQAPTGDLRWRAPVPIAYDSQLSLVINATTPGYACVQNSPAWEPPLNSTTPQDEDCLLLNIQTPMNPTSDSLPVFFYIHGGGYVSGAATSTIGDSLVHQANGSMIFVQVQYRLGPLGFLGGEDVKANGTANAGLLDQRVGLEWVRDNIHYFGGDPSRVTINGGSAGGGSVTMQLILDGGDDSPPFHAAIPEYPWLTPIYDEAWTNQQYTGFLQAANCTTLACLRSLSLSEVEQATRAADESAYAANEYAYGTFYWGPTIDGQVIRDHPYNEFRSGHFTKVPLMIDRDGDEGLAFTNTSIATDQDVLQDFAKLWHDSTGFYANIVMDLYPESIYNASHIDDLTYFNILKQEGMSANFSDAFVRRSSAFGDAIVNCPSSYIASHFADAGLPVYKLIFNAGSQLHAATGAYLFSSYINADGSQVVAGTEIPGNATIATLMRDYFISFTLNQTTDSYGTSQAAFPFWPLYKSNEPQVLLINPTDVSAVHDPEDSERCQFLQMGRGNNKGIWPQW